MLLKVIKIEKRKGTFDTGKNFFMKFFYYSFLFIFADKKVSIYLHLLIYQTINVRSTSFSLEKFFCPKKKS